MPGWQQDLALQSLRQHSNQIDQLVILRYSVLPDGRVVPFSNSPDDNLLVSEARSANIPVLAAIANLDPSAQSENWSSEVVSQVLTDPDSRSRHISALLALAERYDGLIIDYETLHPGQTESFHSFLTVLSDFLDTSGKTLGVTTSSVPEPPYQWDALTQIVDEVHVMSYEQHWATSAPGPVAGLDWYRDIAAQASRVSADSLVMGLPVYGYDWKVGGLGEGVTYARARQIANQFNAEIIWDSQSASPHFVYQANVRHEVWFEDSASAAAKLDTLKSHGINQVFIWFLGGEDLDIWEQLS